MPKARKTAAIILFLFGFGAAGFPLPGASAEDAGDQVRISGRVTDFSNQPIAGASVELKDARFETVVGATSGSDGSYALTAPKGRYQAKSLEYWAWNVPATADLEINPRFDRLEVYAVNAWKPQGAYPSYQIYFRPMSLTRIIRLAVAHGGMENVGKLPVLDIAPDLKFGDIAVTIDGEAVNVLKINKVREAAGPKQEMIGYVIQTELPAQKTDKAFRFLTITIADAETNEKGEAGLFVESGGRT